LASTGITVGGTLIIESLLEDLLSDDEELKGIYI
jgi:hypothetical protein